MHSILLTQSQIFELWQVSAGTQLVEDVVVTLVVCLNTDKLVRTRIGYLSNPSDGRCSHYLKHHSGFLQQIGPHVGADDAVPPVKADLRVLPEAAAVVVPGGLRVSYRLGEKKKKSGLVSRLIVVIRDVIKKSGRLSKCCHSAETER